MVEDGRASAGCGAETPLAMPWLCQDAAPLARRHHPLHSCMEPEQSTRAPRAPQHPVSPPRCPVSPPRVNCAGVSLSHEGAWRPPGPALALQLHLPAFVTHGQQAQHHLAAPVPGCHPAHAVPAVPWAAHLLLPKAPHFLPRHRWVGAYWRAALCWGARPPGWGAADGPWTPRPPPPAHPAPVRPRAVQCPPLASMQCWERGCGGGRNQPGLGKHHLPPTQPPTALRRLRHPRSAPGLAGKVGGRRGAGGCCAAPTTATHPWAGNGAGGSGAQQPPTGAGSCCGSRAEPWPGLGGRGWGSGAGGRGLPHGAGAGKETGEAFGSFIFNPGREQAGFGHAARRDQPRDPKESPLGSPAHATDVFDHVCPCGMETPRRGQQPLGIPPHPVSPHPTTAQPPQCLPTPRAGSLREHNP